jgi:putative addiction module component (TIGR02574 family)
MALWESLTDAQRHDALDLTDEQRQELDRRWEAHQRNPASAVPWTEVRRKLLG